jgi:hypothetical protein
MNKQGVSAGQAEKGKHKTDRRAVIKKRQVGSLKSGGWEKQVDAAMK